METSRRLFVSSSAFVGAGLLISACKPSGGPDGADASSGSGKPDAQAADEVTATEDLMREHGVLRRALIVYREAAALLRVNAPTVPTDALQKTAKLFRRFGEEYHERQLEEAFIFPAVKGASGAAPGYTDTLLAQHKRGREITDYILATTGGAKLGANASVLASVLEGFARMYEEHTAIEDTIIFPAWKTTLSARQLDELGDKFEDIETATLGKDGFEDAVKQMASIEGSMGLTDLAKFTAPAPPRA